MLTQMNHIAIRTVLLNIVQSGDHEAIEEFRSDTASKVYDCIVKDGETAEEQYKSYTDPLDVQACKESMKDVKNLLDPKNRSEVLKIIRDCKKEFMEMYDRSMLFKKDLIEKSN